MVHGEGTGAFAALRGHWYIVLTTFRRDGAGVMTPVWFAVEDGKLYVGTPADSGKVKRIRNNPKVQLAPCTASGRALGPSIEARARVLPADEEAAANQALNRKYGLRRRFFDVLHRLRRRRRALLEILPA